MNVSISSAGELFRSIWGTPGTSEFASACLGGASALIAQYIANRHERRIQTEQRNDEKRARAWAIFFKINNIHETLSHGLKEIKACKERSEKAGLELWQILQFAPHIDEPVAWDIEELVLLVDHREFELMNNYQQATVWLSNFIQSSTMYRDMRLEFVRNRPSTVDGDMASIEADKKELEVIMPTVAHLRSLSNSLEAVVSAQQPEVRKLLLAYCTAMKKIAGESPTLEFLE